MGGEGIGNSVVKTFVCVNQLHSRDLCDGPPRDGEISKALYSWHVDCNS